MLEAFAPDVWIATRPLRFFGLELGTRMTVVRLPSGGLFVHSPVPLDAETKAAVDALGAVRAIVAPCLFHHLSAGAWAAAYPEATVSCCPGLDRKRTDVAWTRVLTDEPAEEWRGALEQVSFSALPMQNEVVFFHGASKTLITSDLMFNLAEHPSRMTRTVAALIAPRRPAPTVIERVMIKDRRAAREQVDRMVAWRPERIVLAHGEPVHTDGAELIRTGYAWL